MRKNRKLYRAVAALMTAAMLSTMGGMTALADSEMPKKTDLDKYLVMDKDANIPNATFEFEIEGIKDDIPSKTENGKTTVAIMAPNAENGVSGSPKVKDAVYSPDLKIATGSDATGPVTDSDLSGNKMWAKVTTEIDFSSVSFTKPGVFRWTITEKDFTTPGITKKEEKTLYLDVYASDENGDGNVDGNVDSLSYILHHNENASYADDTTRGDKDTGFVNKYTTANVSLKKEVTGNQGDKKKEFSFTVNISGAAEGTKYTVELPNDTAMLEAKADGTASGTYLLSHGQILYVKGLTENTKIQITENDYSGEGYTTTNDLTKTDTDKSGLTTDEVEVGTNGRNVTFTNTKSVSTPTGIMLSYGPYILLVLAAGACAVVFFRRRREDY